MSLQRAIYHQGQCGSAMSGRVILVQFRGAPCEVVYQTRVSDPEALTWRFTEFRREIPTKAERTDISDVCLKDFRQRRAEWRAQILRRRIVPDLRRRRWP